MIVAESFSVYVNERAGGGNCRRGVAAIVEALEEHTGVVARPVATPHGNKPAETLLRQRHVMLFVRTVLLTTVELEVGVPSASKCRWSMMS